MWGSNSHFQVNLSYILWIAAFNTSFIFGYLLLDLLFFPSPLSKSVYSPTSKLKIPADSAAFLRDHIDLPEIEGNPPVLLEAINRNGLVIFLVVRYIPSSNCSPLTYSSFCQANVATGLINISIPTMYISDWWAILVLAGYTCGVCGVAWNFRDRPIWKL